VDICPVGALISRDFLFKARVWNLKKTDSVCPGCSRGCNVVVESYEGKVARIRPRLNNAVNGHWMCDHGRLMHGYLDDSERPATPRKREDARTFNIPVSEAVDVIKLNVGGILESDGPEAVAGLVSPWMTNEELHLAGTFFRDTLGGARLAALAAHPGESYEAPGGFRISPDRNPNRRGLQEVLGLAPDLDGVIKLAEDIEAGTVKVLIVLSGIPGAVFPEELVAVASKLNLLVVQDVMTSQLADRAHIVLPGAAFTEKDGSVINDDGRVQRVRPALPPPLPGGDLAVLTALLQIFGDDRGGDSTASRVFDRLAGTNEAFKGLRFESLGALGKPLPGAGAGTE